jgi:sepiapterin reductase
MQSLYIITGANRGFGRALAGLLPLKGKNGPGNELWLLGRNQTTLDTATRELAGGWDKVSCISIDFAALDAIEEKLDDWIPKLTKKEWQHVYLFNNAGVLGPLQRAENLPAKGVREAVDSDLTGTIIFTSRLLKAFKCPITLVNTSSLAAIRPFDTWSVYCTIKAGREMFYQSIAHEAQAHAKFIRVLNYAPGPLDTDMQGEIRDKMPNVDLKKQFETMHSKKQLVEPVDSARKLVRLIEQDKWKNGDHIDYFE